MKSRKVNIRLGPLSVENLELWLKLMVVQADSELSKNFLNMESK
jgi:hypothetical protein